MREWGKYLREKRPGKDTLMSGLSLWTTGAQVPRIFLRNYVETYVSLLKAAVTQSHKLGGLKQQRLILS